MKFDSDIEKDVKEELWWSPELDESDVAVKVASGIVTLSGFVRNYSSKYEAEDIAKRVAGVHGVANDIEVRIPGYDQRADPEIARDILFALKSQLPALWENIQFSVMRGTVSLEGIVEWNYERQLAENSIKRIKGVKVINNFLKLKTKIMPKNVKSLITAAFERNAELDADRINVDMKDGVVILTGTVRSWAEHDAAGRAAWAAAGVAKVANHIVVSW